MDKKRKKSPLKGQPAGKIASSRTIRHLDPQSPLHQQDKKVFATVRARADRQKRMLPCKVGTLGKLKYPSLEGGFCADERLNILNSHEHDRLLESIKSSRKHYYSIVDGRSGKKRRRKRETNPLSHLAISFRPDFAIAFMALDEAKVDCLLGFLLEKALPILFKEFEIATQLEVIACQVHPEEGLLHFHIAYATVSADNELLWPKSGVGRRGIRRLGPSGIGTIRLVEDGFWGEELTGICSAILICFSFSRPRGAYLFSR